MTVVGRTVHGIGYSNDVAGGFAQYMPLAERLLLEVPNGLPAAHADSLSRSRWAGTPSRKHG
jgi:D-arabinose 1-dehydrogenase-like Zn-dependent alcohol dehydrogenase